MGSIVYLGRGSGTDYSDQPPDGKDSTPGLYTVADPGGGGPGPPLPLLKLVFKKMATT